MTLSKTFPQSEKSLETKKRSRKWAKDRPKRPMTPYNFFFQHERNKLLQSKAKVEKSPLNVRRRGVSTGTGFAGLAKHIAAKWKILKDTEKEIFESQAADDKRRYLAELEIWKKGKEHSQERSVSATTPMEGFHLPETISSLFDGVDGQLSSALCDMEQAIGRTVLAMSTQNKNFLRQMIMFNSNNVDVAQSVWFNCRNLNEVQPGDFEPIPISSMTAGESRSSGINGRSPAFANSIKSDLALKKSMPVDSTTHEQNDNTFGVPFQCMENVDDRSDRDFLGLLQAFPN